MSTITGGARAGDALIDRICDLADRFYENWGSMPDHVRLHWRHAPTIFNDTSLQLRRYKPGERIPDDFEISGMKVSFDGPRVETAVFFRRADPEGAFQAMPPMWEAHLRILSIPAPL